MKNTYLALTIGPIYKTLSQAQRTREFWGGSYLFSWIMREIIIGMIEEKTITKDDILMPHRDKHENLKIETGLYHDRMIARVKPDKKEQVLKDFKNVTDAVLTKIAETTGKDLSVLQSYFRLNTVLFDLEEGENIVETVTNYLDSLELQNPVFHKAYQIDWPSMIDDLNGRLFYTDAGIDFVFDSIPEIASRGLEGVNKTEYKKLVQQFIKDKFDTRKPKNKEVEDQDEFIKHLSGSEHFKKEFHNYHKYIAIVHADGDNLGETIRKIGSDADKVKKLSEALFCFASKAVGIIAGYGGTNVYAGGDDLLFFAPVATTNEEKKQTIFDLINNLDELFRQEVSRNPELTEILAEPKPTLSWGVSVSYYKFPLSEAIVSSRELLFDDAKGHEGKNAVAFRLIKHTGQFFGATFGKGNDDYNVHFQKLLEQAFLPDTDFISSLQYRISDNEALLRESFNVPDYPIRIKNFFDNFFDEEIHSNKKDFVHAVRDMLVQTFCDSNIPHEKFKKMTDEEKEKAHKKQVKTAIDKTYSALRFIHFLNSKSDE